MSRILARTIGVWIGVAALGVGGIAGAQSTQADFIVNSAATLLRIDRTTMAVTSFASPGAVANRQIWTFPEQLDTYSLDLATTNVLYRVTPTGAVTTVATYPNGLSWVGHGDYDHDGSFVTYTRTGVVRFDRQGVVTTILANPSVVGVTFDGDSGDLIVFEPLQNSRSSASHRNATNLADVLYALTVCARKSDVTSVVAGRVVNAQKSLRFRSSTSGWSGSYPFGGRFRLSPSSAPNVAAKRLPSRTRTHAPALSTM